MGIIRSRDVATAPDTSSKRVKNCFLPAIGSTPRRARCLLVRLIVVFVLPCHLVRREGKRGTRECVWCVFARPPGIGKCPVVICLSGFCSLGWDEISARQTTFHRLHAQGPPIAVLARPCSFSLGGSR